MLHFSSPPKFLPALLLVFLTASLLSQTPAQWSVAGNAIGGADFLGTTNNQPLIFYTNNQEAMRIKPDGQLKIISLSTNGYGFVTANSSGALSATAFTNDTSMVLFGDGVFRPLDKAAGWGMFGTDLYNTNLGNVGIGTSSPSYLLDVNGNVRLNGKTYVYRFIPLPGDSLIRFGDSTITINTNTNRIEVHPAGSNKGFVIGFDPTTRALGFRSVSIGYKTITDSSASYSFIIGSGVQNGTGVLYNKIPNSLMIGFNSNIPTLFVGSSNGAETIGKVGIGTSNPQAMFQVGDGLTSVSMGSSYGVANTFSVSYIGFNASRLGSNQWTTNNDGANNGGIVLLADVGGGLRFIGLKSTGATNPVYTDGQIAANTKIYIRNDGRVIVGKDQITPNGIYDDNFTRMTVDGRIMCKDLVVSTVADWPDFVFDSAYVLMPMDSLGEYVAYYKHLPGTVSAQVQEQNGFSISETCKKQQLQIEELTLYILQLNERLKALEAEKQKGK